MLLYYSSNAVYSVEGIAYAIQGHYAKEVKPIGSLAPRISDQEDHNLKMRKALGQKLRPEVAKYLIKSRVIDDNFLAFAAQALSDQQIH